MSVFSMGYNIEIRNGKKATYYYREDLKKMGFKFKKTSEYCSCWYAHTTLEEQVEAVKKYCKDHKLNFFMYEDKYERSNNYRKIYFENNKPVFKDYYICVYCGTPVHEKNVTVDHIVPVKKAKKKKMYQKILQVTKIEAVNDPKNLVCACYSCNARKSSKGGFWVLRGFLGKFKIYWVLNIAFWIVSISWLIYFLYTSMMELVP